MIRRLLIAILLALTITATVFDCIMYSDLTIWKWNQGIAFIVTSI